MSFVLYDLTFLVLFTLVVVLFLYTHRKNLKRQGILYLYRTNIGLKIIETTSKKYAKILKPLQYVIIGCGYVLMAVMIYLLVTLVRLYTSNAVVRETKIPPILPLIPYLPDLFKVEFLPPFYFTYWIVIIGVVAIVHEFGHGILARFNKITVHSTGFGFLGPFLAAFVEPDDKQMQKSSKFVQLAILGAGTFANVLMTILFGLVMWGFFALSFAPVGVNFNAYGTSPVDLSAITSVNGLLVETPQDLGIFSTNESLQRIHADGRNYLIYGTVLAKAAEGAIPTIMAYDDAPAINAQFKGPIISIDGTPTRSIEELRSVLAGFSPGNTIIVETAEDGVRESVRFTLADRNGSAYLGVGFVEPPKGKVLGVVFSVVSSIKDPFVYYEPTYGGDFVWFIYDLLWWMVIINISVALMNMLPVGIFDGGRFFYLTIWGITGKEKVGRYAFAIATYAILAIFVWMTLRWVFVFF